MSRNVIVELEPAESLASLSASLMSARTSATTESVAAAINAAALPAALPGFRLDTRFPPTPVPHVVQSGSTNSNFDAAPFAASNAFNVASRLRVETAPLAVPYIVRGEIDSDAEAESLAARPNVRRVYSDPFIQSFRVCPGSPALGTDKDVAELLCVDRLAAAGMDGRGVLLAIVDTGINLAHLQAHGKNPTVDVAQSWKPATAGSSTPFAFPVDHGTMCAYDALIAAPRATLLDIAVLQSRTPGGSAIEGLLSDAVLAYSHLLGLLRDPNRRPGDTVSLVISNSWGVFDPAWDFPPDSIGNYTDNLQHPFNRIVATLESFGADILFAAGNCGTDCPDGRCRWPDGQATISGASSHPTVLCVAGVDVTGERAGYSSTGPGRLTDEKPDISGLTHFAGSGVYPSDGGTSAACPVVAGVVAAVRSQLPASTGAGNSSPAAMRNLVRKTATERGNVGFDYAYGWGIVNGCALSQLASTLSVHSDSETVAAIARLKTEIRGASSTSGPARGTFTTPSVAASTGVKTITARLKAGGAIKSALISTPENIQGEDFTGTNSDEDMTATISTDGEGVLDWAITLRTDFVNTSWQLTLTESGGTEGDPDAAGFTNGSGFANASGEKEF